MVERLSPPFLLFIVAATHRHAEVWAKDHGIEKPFWRYISSAAEIYGLAPSMILAVLPNWQDTRPEQNIDAIEGAIYHHRDRQRSLYRKRNP